MKKLDWFLGVVASIAVIVAWLFTSFEIAMYEDYDVYRQEYEKYQVLDQLDMSMDDVMDVTTYMMEYLRGNEEELSIVTTVEGTKQDFFNEQDRFHMGEVQGLFLGGLAIRNASIGVVVLCLAIIAIRVFRRRRQEKGELSAPLVKMLSRSYQVTLVVSAVVIAVIGIAVARDFDAVFTIFHQIFFDNSLWIFDPATDFMIRMLPEGLFYDMVIRIGVIFVVGLAVVLVLSILAPRIQANVQRRHES